MRTRQMPITPRQVKPIDPEVEFRSYGGSAKTGVLHIRTLDDRVVLAAARDRHGRSKSFAGILAFMGAGTNPRWIRSQCAEEAYVRGLIDEHEFDALTD